MSAGPDEIDRLWARFRDAVAGSAAPRPKAVVLAWGVVGALATLLALAPVVLVTDMPQDVLIPLDGALRMASGQRPHLDFQTPIGDLYYWALAFGAAVRGPLDPRLLAATNAFAGLVTLALALAATRWRLPEPLRSFTAVAVALLAMSPRRLDDAAMIGFNAMYNRWSWALATIVLLAVLLEPEGDDRKVRPAEVALLGGLLLAVFWTKVTFLPLCLLAVGLGVLAAPSNRGTALAGGALGVALVAVTALSTNGSAYLSDLRVAAEAGAGGPGLIRVDRLSPAVDANRPALLLTIVVAFALLRTAASDAQRRYASGVVVALLGLGAGTVLISSQNNDRTIPALVVGTLLAVAALRARPDRSLVPVASVAAMLQLAWPTWLEARAIVAHAALGSGPTIPLYADPESPLHGVRAPAVVGPEASRIALVRTGEISGNIYDNLVDVSWPIDTPHILADAVQLLDTHRLRGRPIASLTFSPFFPYLLGATPPRGLPAWWDWQRTFGPSWDTRACAALAESEVVLEPHVWNITGIHEENRACLEAEFERLDETALWILWVRR